MDVRRLTICLTLAAACLLWLPVTSLGDLSHDISARSQTASQLRAAIAAESKRIETTAAGLSAARARLSALQGRVTASQAQLAAVQQRIVAARNRLTRLENRMHDASTALAANLVSSYKDDSPDMVTVIVNSHGFADMLEALEFMERARERDARVLSDTRATRIEVLAQTARLQKLLERNRALTAAVTRLRDQAAAVEGALLKRQAEQLQARATTAARLDRVRGQISSLKHRLARLSHPVVTAIDNNLPVDAGGYAQAPAGAPAAVKQVASARPCRHGVDPVPVRSARTTARRPSSV